MPKLLAVLVCEKVIVDQQQVPSLIGVFQRINVQLLDAPLPENAVTPMKWAVFALWEHTKDEQGKTFIQRLQVLKPDGSTFIDNSQPFQVRDPDFLQSKNTAEIFGIPADKEGEIKVRVWIEGEEERGGGYSYSVKHQPKENHGKSSNAKAN